MAQYGATRCRIDERSYFPRVKSDDRLYDAPQCNRLCQWLEDPGRHVAQIIRYCESTKPKAYWNPHRDCEAIDQIARNDEFVAIDGRIWGLSPFCGLPK